MAASDSKHLYHTLDAARGMAALVVVLYHTKELLHFNPVPSGFLAVDFFFALSGFVLAHAYASKLASGRLSTRQFMVVRLIRLYPLYLLGLMLMLGLLLVQAATGAGMAWSATALTGKLPFAFFMLPSPTLDVTGFLYPFNIPAWSIFFELLVNFFYAAFYRHLQSLRVRWAVILLSGTALVVQFLVLGIDQSGPAWNTLLLGVARVSFSFFLGVQLYEWHQRHFAQRPALHGGWSLLGLVLLTACLAAPELPAFHLLAIFLIFPALIMLLARSQLSPGWRGAALRQLGVLSYAIYMLHFGVGFIVDALLSSLRVPPERWPLAVLPLIAAVLLLSWCADRWFDRPVRSWLQSWSPKRRAVQLPGP